MTSHNRETPTPATRPKAGYYDRSLPNDARAKTRQQLEAKLVALAAIARERDDEPGDVADALEEQLDGTPPATHVHQPQRPIERFLKLIGEKHSPSVAIAAVAGRIPLASGDSKIDRARACFSAMGVALHILDVEEQGEKVMDEWGEFIKETGEMRGAVMRWTAAATRMNERIDDAIRQSAVGGETLLPQLPLAIGHFDVGADVDALAWSLGLAAARICPDVMNFAKGTGGQATRYSLGRLLMALRFGRLCANDGVRSVPAFTRSELLELVVDDLTVDAANGRDKRYDRALDAYASLQPQIYPETPSPTSGALERSDT